MARSEQSNLTIREVVMKTRAATPLRRRSRTAAFPSEEDLISVLFIEDDAHLAEMYRLKLETDGYQVTIAESEESVKQVLPDLIYLDIRAPHRDRVRVLRRLRAHDATKPIPVVILSDYPEQELIDAGADLGVGEYVVRSAGPTSLSQGIEEWGTQRTEID